MDLIVIFNHELTRAQQKDALCNLEAARILYPPGHVKRLWSQIRPAMDGLKDYLAPVMAWLKDAASPGDHVLVQGELGAVYLVVGSCLEPGLVPVYSTTERHAVERPVQDGIVELQHRFKHVRFRKYGL